MSVVDFGSQVCGVGGKAISAYCRQRWVIVGVDLSKVTGYSMATCSSVDGSQGPQWSQIYGVKLPIYMSSFRMSVQDQNLDK